MNNLLIHESRVGSKTEPIKLATSIIFSIKSGKILDVIAIGVNTINIANKALILANILQLKVTFPYLFPPLISWLQTILAKIKRQ